MERTRRHEAFIPCFRKDTIQLCLEDGGLAGETAEDFQTFCQGLTALFHVRFHHLLEEVKDNYRPFNPNADRSLHQPAPAAYQPMSQKVIQGFQALVERANYLPLAPTALQALLEAPSPLNLSTQVDLNDFEHVLSYYRGCSETTLTQRRFFLWNQRQTVQCFERLVLLMQFKQEGYFHGQQGRPRRQGFRHKFIPGKIYLFFYKNLPQPNLRLLFPNLKISMPLRARLLFALPTAGAAVPLAIKFLINLLVILTAIWVVWHPDTTREVVQDDFGRALDFTVKLIGLLIVGFTVGNFTRQQYSLYKAKKLRVQKAISDTLFFKSLGTHASVFQMLSDIAEEEECKEIILVYYHLLVSPNPIPPEVLKSQIENWLFQKTGVEIDFDIQGPLQTLQAIGETVDQESVEPFPGQSSRASPLLSYDDQGCCQILPLPQANVVLGSVWNQAFLSRRPPF